ncbi:MAG: hypothetical protein L3J68_03580 [Thermoplasmata archaeon]|jgi:hypothetical protein|nr:hypothetical protein [Thermoplasmata archaeon]
MTHRDAAASPESEPPPKSGFVATLPLLVLTFALFLGSYLVYLEAPHLGPVNFPLWGLMLTLGFVAAIGSVVSWFFATDDRGSTVEEEEPTSSDAAPDPPLPRKAFGRPAPELVPPIAPLGPSSGLGHAAAVAGTKPAAPWDEDALPPVSARGPRPVLTTLDDPGEIGRALEEIADIQRQLTTRPSPAAGRTEAPARA